MKRFRRKPASGEPGPDFPEDSIVPLLEDRLGQIQDELTVAAGGASLCSISKVAGSVPAAKYLEGRLAVVLHLRRRTGTTEEARAALHELRSQWDAELARVTEGNFGPDWRGYRAGGVDELDELANVLG